MILNIRLFPLPLLLWPRNTKMFFCLANVSPPLLSISSSTPIPAPSLLRSFPIWSSHLVEYSQRPSPTRFPIPDLIMLTLFLLNTWPSLLKCRYAFYNCYYIKIRTVFYQLLSVFSFSYTLSCLYLVQKYFFALFFSKI